MAVGVRGGGGRGEGGGAGEDGSRGGGAVGISRLEGIRK